MVSFKGNYSLLCCFQLLSQDANLLFQIDIVFPNVFIGPLQFAQIIFPIFDGQLKLMRL